MIVRLTHNYFTLIQIAIEQQSGKRTSNLKMHMKQILFSFFIQKKNASSDIHWHSLSVYGDQTGHVSIVQQATFQMALHKYQSTKLRTSLSAYPRKLDVHFSTLKTWDFTEFKWAPTWMQTFQDLLNHFNKVEVEFPRLHQKYNEIESKLRINFSWKQVQDIAISRHCLL